ncbi:Outer membrane protein MIM1/TOM13 mitochondrial [Lasiodiplodia theobromae]|uniref:Mitochondrial import protein 1 n=2 Tax=Lasiodiplodia TaxID=66739 RepID=A0A5N5DFT0_9PEZI|nr:Mitochondrial import protein [Lasiodiplodia theobromae]KAB2576688.1 Mitochondrial import protein 1 [Lasiodiplodia theobromae]KAF4534085.1 Mitochondrial import protein [Lasiodiplodia theobromae]KAF9633067.1 Outer membrane protein MIM1/TOM13 mitochondrial [Lasiodiplodia theobromae]KAK0663198.1 Mitochondrial import protein 1 [Lasiodiplodia hormozganensis]
MASPAPERNAMSESVTIPSDSENYDGNNELSSSPPSSSSSPVILYHPPTLWGLMRGAAINLVLPFINGLMLGFGELFAHEIAFRLGWSGTKVFPVHRSNTRRVGPGVQMQSDPVRRRRRSGEEIDMYAALE